MDSADLKFSQSFTKQQTFSASGRKQDVFVCVCSYFTVFIYLIRTVHIINLSAKNININMPEYKYSKNMLVVIHSSKASITKKHTDKTPQHVDKTCRNPTLKISPESHKGWESIHKTEKTKRLPIFFFLQVVIHRTDHPTFNETFPSPVQTAKDDFTAAFLSSSWSNAPGKLSLLPAAPHSPL